MVLAIDWRVYPLECGERSVVNVPVMLNGRVPPFEVSNTKIIFHHGEAEVFKRLEELILFSTNVWTIQPQS